MAQVEGAHPIFALRALLPIDATKLLNCVVHVYFPQGRVSSVSRPRVSVQVVEKNVGERLQQMFTIIFA